MDVSFELTSDPSTEQSDFIYEALRQYNLQHTENDNHVLLRIFARNDKGELVGGLLGGTYIFEEGSFPQFIENSFLTL